MSPWVAGKPAPNLDRLTEDLRLGDCPRCDRRVLRGLVDGFDTRIELQPVTPAQEVGLLLAGWSTFEVQVKKGFAWAIWRTLWDVANQARRGRPRPIVMPRHYCNPEESR